jgi:hypothetical protein
MSTWAGFISSLEDWNDLTDDEQSKFIKDCQRRPEVQPAAYQQCNTKIDDSRCTENVDIESIHGTDYFTSICENLDDIEAPISTLNHRDQSSSIS